MLSEDLHFHTTNNRCKYDFFFLFCNGFFLFHNKTWTIIPNLGSIRPVEHPELHPGFDMKHIWRKIFDVQIHYSILLVNFETTFLLKNNLNRKKNSNRILYTVTLYIFINTKSSTYVFVTSGKVYKNIVKFFRFVFLFSYLKTKSLLNHQLSVHILQIQLQNNFHVKLYVHGTHKSNTHYFLISWKF